ncbi:TIGR03084 family metal-binding protein [Nocardioides carbamazepini]|uniref:TIGR03084 family metal-binding protein n=1 Tax=Nocardioides carbamazepini TaxID=2854259 RepID=UPI002149D076|nr:TIGR03084 family metal-binding protein [Nocardioides carbamazepini]
MSPVNPVNRVLDDLLVDLATESHLLRTAVATADAWSRATPAQGWTVATQVAHLVWTDEVATIAAGAGTEKGKAAWDAVVLKAIENPTGFVDASAHELAALPPAELLGRWDLARAGLVTALWAQPAGTRMPWFGPPMSPTSMATARFMETWAHGLDVYETIGAVPEPTDRVRHVAHIGVRTRDFAYANNGLEAPAEEFRVELTGPSGAVWTWGPEDAAQRVTGEAYDFCRLVTQRIHRDDTSLKAVGDDAERWLTIAQAFAGPAGGGRDPR